jgi:hypothetical protein
MDSPAVKLSAPSTQPALELIGLAQLSPDLARKRLRALLLANPNYFGKVPSKSFSAVLNIEEDTTYESIGHLGYDPQLRQLSAVIDVKQGKGYSNEVLVQGSQEFVRFYLSYDGGSTWLDQGMGSIHVADAHWPRPLAYEVHIQIDSASESFRDRAQTKIRAILSWNMQPPTGEPGWKPIWGQVAESDIHIEDSRVIVTRRTDSAAHSDRLESALHVRRFERPMEFTSAIAHGHLSRHALHSSETDPQHRFLAYVLAKAAGYGASSSSASLFDEKELFRTTKTAPELCVSANAEPVFAAIS